MKTRHVALAILALLYAAFVVNWLSVQPRTITDYARQAEQQYNGKPERVIIEEYLNSHCNRFNGAYTCPVERP